MNNWYKKAQHFNDGRNTAMFEYISRRQKPGMNEEEKRIRDISYRLKNKEDVEAIEFAASAMAKQVRPNSILIPIPSSSGLTDANMALANAIASKTNSKVYDILSRSEPTIPLHQRRKTEGIKGEIGSDYHKMTIKEESLLSQLARRKLIYLVDNVITSGSTLDAARKALNLPKAFGIAFSKVFSI